MQHWLMKIPTQYQLLPIGHYGNGISSGAAMQVNNHRAIVNSALVEHALTESYIIQHILQKFHQYFTNGHLFDNLDSLFSSQLYLTRDTELIPWVRCASGNVYYKSISSTSGQPMFL